MFPIFLWTTMYCCSFSTLLKKYSFYESLSSFQHCEWILLHCCLYIYSMHCFLQQQSGKMGCLVFLLLNSFFSLSFFAMQFLFSGLSWLQFTWFFSSSIFEPVLFKCFVELLVWMCSSTVPSSLKCKVFIGSTSKRSSGSTFEDSYPFSNVIRISSIRILIFSSSSDWGFEFSISWGW